ncbi:DJ-1/PfpI family protein [Aquimarina sp. 2304DJ70-9]|uniref:DJ-1/PfpI family protein n=1 Tax=Aquimarina penaris TaxID=3231044 RepID=UPI0034626CB1
MKRNVGILIFDNAEVLDFAGPFEVFSVSSEIHNHELFNVFCVAKNLEPVSAVNGLSVNPQYSFENAPKIDILIIAGGEGTKKLIQDKDVLSWLKKTHKETELTLSICSGSRLLGVLGELDNKPYCTHHQVYENMKEIVPTGKPQESKRFVNAGKIYTSGGISAGIDLSFHIVNMLHGEKVADRTAEYMEYDSVNY